MTTEPNPYPPAPRLNVLAHVPSGVRTLLDVRCNTGAFGRELKRQRPGILVWRVEPRLAAASAAARVLDHVISGLYPDVMLDADQKFDCVVFNDVLEHMPRPQDALRAATRSLTPDGVVMAAVPNVRYVRIVYDLVVRGRWTYTETGILDKTHVRFFTRHPIGALFREAGYSVERTIALDIFGERFGVTKPQRLLLRDFSHGQFLVVGRPDKAAQHSLANDETKPLTAED